MKSPGPHHLPWLGTLAPELPIFRLERSHSAFELGPKGKALDPVRCSDWAPLSPPRIPLDSCHPTVLRTHRLPGAPPAALASPDANISAMPCDATSSPSLSLLSSCAGIHPMQIATHTLSYIEIANIRNVPDMDSISFFADILSLTCEFEKRIDGTLQLEVFTTGKAAPSHVQKSQNLEMCNASVSQFQESIRFLKHAAWVSQRIGSWKLQCSSRNRRCGIIRWKS